MNVRIGFDSISPHQSRMIERASRSQHPGVLFDLFREIIQDDGITGGTESLDPRWIELFRENRDNLVQFAPKPLVDPLSVFFDTLTPIDPEIQEIDPSSQRVSFLLGAGASKPQPSGIPTVKELLPQLLERARRLDRDDVNRLADFCDRRKIDNIEDLLTAAHLATFCSRNPTVLRLLNFLLYRGDVEESPDSLRYKSSWEIERFEMRRSRDTAADLSSVAFLQDTLQVLFGLLSSTMLPAKPNAAHEAIAEYAKAHRDTAVVTTNYDCCMDLALGEVSRDFSYRLEFANYRSPSEPVTNGSRLIKLHGSLNWFYCETCQEVQLIDIRQTVTNFLEDRALYPVIGVCKDCGGQRRVLLVPPLAMKFDVAPPLTPLLGDAKSAFDGADVIVVVGFSFADADLYISRMVSKAMQNSPRQRLVIADPDGRVVDRVRRKFKASIPNFSTSRIVQMSGDCAETLPRLLKGEYRESGTLQSDTENGAVVLKTSRRRQRSRPST